MKKLTACLMIKNEPFNSALPHHIHVSTNSRTPLHGWRLPLNGGSVPSVRLAPDHNVSKVLCSLPVQAVVV